MAETEETTQVAEESTVSEVAEAPEAPPLDADQIAQLLEQVSGVWLARRWVVVSS